MNNKASKNQIQFPPLLNTEDNEVHIDTSFQRVERINAPYMNEMLTPLYKKEYDEAFLVDKDDNHYSLKDGLGIKYFYKNDSVLGTINNKHFEKTELHFDSNVLSYDINDYYLIFDDVKNKIKVEPHIFQSSLLFTEGKVITGRVLKIDDDVISATVYENDIGETHLLYTRNDIGSDVKVEWKRQYARLNGSAQYNQVAATPLSVNPLIQICKKNGAFIVSLVNEYGYVMNSRESCYFTYVEYNDHFYSNFTPKNVATHAEVPTSVPYAFSQITTSYRGNIVTLYAISADNTTFYEYSENTKGPELTVPSGNAITATGETVEIDNVTYNIYSYVKTQSTYTAQATTNQPTKKWILSIGDNTSTYTASSDDAAVASKTVSFIVYTWATESLVYLDSLSITAYDKAADNTEIPVTDLIPEKYWNANAPFVTTRTEITASATVSFLVAPNIFLDNGRAYSLYSFTQNTSAWSYAFANGNYIVEALPNVTWEVNNDALQYTFTISDEAVVVTDNKRCPRSNSAAFGQNFIQTVTRACNPESGWVPSKAADGTATGTDTTKYCEWTNSNAYPLTYLPGTVNDTSSNYYASNGYREDALCYVPVGVKTKLSNKFSLLYNVDITGTAVIQGVSYNETPDMIGTLLTDWQSVDGSFYITGNDTSFIYRDKDYRYWKIEIKDGTEMHPILDRFILFNTTSYYNLWDKEKNRFYHYASDYNNRVLFGITSWNDATINNSSDWDKNNMRTTASGVNAHYNIMPRNPVVSRIDVPVARYRTYYTSQKALECNVAEDERVLGIDVYYSDNNSTTAKYRNTIYPYSVDVYKKNPLLLGLAFPDYSVTNMNPDIWATFINGAGNNDFVQEGYTNYALVYNSQQEPVLLYTQQSETDNVEAFIVIQGQYYAVINDKIYAALYDNGYIQQLDAIVDIKGFKFIGNNPGVAFFYSKSQRAIYSLTGDAMFQILFDASRFNDMRQHWYDESTQSVYVATDAGLLVFGQNNNYLLEDLKNVTEIEFSGNYTYITNDNKTTQYAYYPFDGSVSNHIILETSFYGLGSTEVSTIDRWNIQVRSPDKDKHNIKVGVRSITDMVTTSEEKTLTLNPADYDKWNNGVLVSYNPAIIKGQGLRLLVDSELPIIQYTAHLTDQNTTTATNKRFSI